MIGFYNYTVILTYVGLISSVYGIFMANEGRVESALICLMIAGVCDLFDGRIARTMDRTKEEKRFGIQIDSLCDLIGFGVLPAVIGYSITGYSRVAIIVYMCFVLAAVIRLAYFNVTEETRQETESGDREYYQGLPVTTISIIMPLFFLVAQNTENFQSLLLALMAFIALCFVTNIRVSKHPIANAKEIIIEKIHNR